MTPSNIIHFHIQVMVVPTCKILTLSYLCVEHLSTVAGKLLLHRTRDQLSVPQLFNVELNCTFYPTSNFVSNSRYHSVF